MERSGIPPFTRQLGGAAAMGQRVVGRLQDSCRCRGRSCSNLARAGSATMLTLPCPCRKSNPVGLMVPTPEVRVGHDAANGLNTRDHGAFFFSERCVRAPLQSI